MTLRSALWLVPNVGRRVPAVRARDSITGELGLDCPGGMFQGAGVKTVVPFFEKGAPTRKVWFYSVKNPNGGEEVVHRSPQVIMDEIATLDAESAEVLATIRGLL